MNFRLNKKVIELLLKKRIQYFQNQNKEAMNACIAEYCGSIYASKKYNQKSNNMNDSEIGKSDY